MRHSILVNLCCLSAALAFVLSGARSSELTADCKRSRYVLALSLSLEQREIAEFAKAKPICPLNIYVFRFTL